MNNTPLQNYKPDDNSPMVIGLSRINDSRNVHIYFIKIVGDKKIFLNLWFKPEDALNTDNWNISYMDKNIHTEEVTSYSYKDNGAELSEVKL